MRELVHVRLAQYKRSKGAVKLHLVLDHDGYLSQFAVISDGKEGDIAAAKKMPFAPMLVFDRGYADYDWWLALTRLKGNADYEVVDQRVPSSDPKAGLREKCRRLPITKTEKPSEREP